MRQWSVQLEATSYNDDTCNGTFEECLEYCIESDFKIDGVECRLAEIEVENGVAAYVYRYYVE